MLKLTLLVGLLSSARAADPGPRMDFDGAPGGSSALSAALTGLTVAARAARPAVVRSLSPSLFVWENRGALERQGWTVERDWRSRVSVKHRAGFRVPNADIAAKMTEFIMRGPGAAPGADGQVAEEYAYVLANLPVLERNGWSIVGEGRFDFALTGFGVRLPVKTDQESDRTYYLERFLQGEDGAELPSRSARFGFVLANRALLAQSGWRLSEFVYDGAGGFALKADGFHGSVWDAERMRDVVLILRDGRFLPDDPEAYILARFPLLRANGWSAEQKHPSFPEFQLYDGSLNRDGTRFTVRWTPEMLDVVRRLEGSN